MATIAIILVIVGILVLLFGLFMLVKPETIPEAPVVRRDATLALSDLKDVLEQIVALLKLFDKKLRTGIFVMLVGLTLVLAGIFLATRDAAAKADDKTSAGASSSSVLTR